jgi:hypothetical protein
MKDQPDPARSRPLPIHIKWTVFLQRFYPVIDPADSLKILNKPGKLDNDAKIGPDFKTSHFHIGGN